MRYCYSTWVHYSYIFSITAWLSVYLNAVDILPSEQTCGISSQSACYWVESQRFCLDVRAIGTFTTLLILSSFRYLVLWLHNGIAHMLLLYVLPVILSNSVTNATCSESVSLNVDISCTRSLIDCHLIDFMEIKIVFSVWIPKFQLPIHLYTFITSKGSVVCIQCTCKQ